MKSVVFIHAHPDDEALLSGGTLRALHQKGIRTVVIFLTSGQMGLTGKMQGDLGTQRELEAKTSASILGVTKTYFLGYHDSGLDSTSVVPSELREEIVQRIRQILKDEIPSTLIGYDVQGGYGHPDHKLVHHIVRSFYDDSEISTLLEVTVDRSVIASTLDRFRYPISIIDKVKLIQADNIWALADRFSASADIGYRINVKAFAAAKRSALKAHASQLTGGIRNLRIMTLLPLLLFKRFFSTEWYVVIRDSDENPLKLLQQIEY